MTERFVVEVGAPGKLMELHRADLASALDLAERCVVAGCSVIVHDEIRCRLRRARGAR